MTRLQAIEAALTQYKRPVMPGPGHARRDWTKATGPEALLTHRFLSGELSCYGLPSTATMRNMAYLSPTLRFSLYSFEACQALAFSMLSHCWMATRFAGAPSNTVPLLAASSSPPFSLISACALGAYSFMYASLLPTSISAMV